MAKDLGLCCPLCLGVDDPSGMLAVTISHKFPPGERQIHLCIACFSAVIEAARQQNDELNGRGDFGDESVAESSSASVDNDNSAGLPSGDIYESGPLERPAVESPVDAQSLPPANDKTADGE
jgi:hypothetical protein